MAYIDFGATAATTGAEQTQSQPQQQVQPGLLTNILTHPLTGALLQWGLIYRVSKGWGVSTKRAIGTGFVVAALGLWGKLLQTRITGS